jgi:hypothetical protein
MKTLKLFLVLLTGIFLFNSCQKNEGISPLAASSTVNVTQPATTKMTDLVINSSFDWKTTKKYQFTFTGNVTGSLSVSSSDGSIYHKALLTSATPYVITLNLPSYESTVHFLYNGKDVVYTLSSSAINYKFN